MTKLCAYNLKQENRQNFIAIISIIKMDRGKTNMGMSQELNEVDLSSHFIPELS